MAKHAFDSPAFVSDEGSPLNSRKWITHVWREGTDNKGQHWEGWYWSNRVNNFKRTRLSRRTAFNLNGGGHHDIDFRHHLVEGHITPFILIYRECAAMNYPPRRSWDKVPEGSFDFYRVDDFCRQIPATDSICSALDYYLVPSHE